MVTSSESNQPQVVTDILVQLVCSFVSPGADTQWFRRQTSHRIPYSGEADPL